MPKKKTTDPISLLAEASQGGVAEISQRLHESSRLRRSAIRDDVCIWCGDLKKNTKVTEQSLDGWWYCSHCYPAIVECEKGDHRYLVAYKDGPYRGRAVVVYAPNQEVASKHGMRLLSFFQPDTGEAKPVNIKIEEVESVDPTGDLCPVCVDNVKRYGVDIRPGRPTVTVPIKGKQVQVCAECADRLPGTIKVDE